MARNIRWMIPFKTLDERDAVINIYKEGNFNEVITLEPAYNTFETQESTDEELMNPIRTHTGYIRIIDNGDISGLMPSDNRQHYVEFLIEGDLKWCGYMQADTFSEDWDITPLEVEFPVISGIGILDSIPMDQNREMDLTSLCSLLLECIDATGVDYNYIYIPKEVKESAASEFYLLPLDLRISRFNFFKVNNSVNTDDPDWERYDADTYSDLLEELCKFWGWTIHERGRDLYLVSTRDVDYMKIPIGELRQKLNSLSSVSYESVPTSSMAVSDMKLAGNSHKKDILQGYNKIKISAKVSKVENVIPNIDSEKMKYIGRWVDERKIEGDIYRQTYKLYKQQIDLEMFESYLYDYNINTGAYTGLSQYATIEEKFNAYGAIYAKMDKTRVNEWDKKRNYNWDDIIRMNLAFVYSYKDRPDSFRKIFPTESQSNEMPILRLRSKESVFYKNGAFVISGTTEGEDYEMILYPDGSMILDIVTRATNGACIIPVVLKIGNKYWNGKSWQSTWAKFDVRCGDNDSNGTGGSGQIVTTKTLDMPYNGANGYVIPIKEELSGIVEMTFLYPYKDDRAGRIFISGLKVEYYKEDDVYEEREDSDENEYSSKSGIEFSKDLSVELKLATNNNNPAAYSILFNSPWAASGSSAEILYFVGEGMKRPEEYLLSNLKRIYGRITEKLTLQMEREDSVTPLMRLTRSGKRYILLSENVNWSDGTVEYIIEDLP